MLQRILAQDPTLDTSRQRYPSRRGPDIRAIIISPTRELAEQIAVEARKLTQGTSVVVQTAVGGTGKSMGLSKIHREGCHILVATPGRLNDILSDQQRGVAAPNLDAFVLDEADRLLDDGFAPEIQHIKDLLPAKSVKDHQTLMFSATMPSAVNKMVDLLMKPGYRFIKTLQEGDQETHEKVPQKMVQTTGLDNMLPALLELLRREISNQDVNLPFKAIVFFNANAEVILNTLIFRKLSGFGNRQCPVIEMHSRLSQQQRTHASDSFRRAKSAILFSSDVTSRGMDFPNVTHIVQIGLPRQKESYIHRIGRTARGDKTGEGWIFVSSIEQGAARFRLPRSPISQDTSLEAAGIDLEQDTKMPDSTATGLAEIRKAAQSVGYEAKLMAYKASLGVFQSVRQKDSLIRALNEVATHVWAMEEAPAIPRFLAAKLGFLKVPGLNIDTSPPTANRNGGPSHRGGYSDRPSFSSSKRPFGQEKPRGQYSSHEGLTERSRGGQYSGHSGPTERSRRPYEREDRFSRGQSSNYDGTESPRRSYGGESRFSRGQRSNHGDGSKPSRPSSDRFRSNRQQGRSIYEVSEMAKQSDFDEDLGYP